MTIPHGTYDHTEVKLVLITIQGKKLSADLRTTFGGFFRGDRTNYDVTLRLRENADLTTDFGFVYNDFRLPNGNFKTRLGRARITYSFTPSIFVHTLIQYNGRADVWSANLRFSWLQRAKTGLFLVFNEASDTADGFGIDNPVYRSITLKYSHLFDVFR